MRLFACCFAACLVPVPALAHPGHGVTEGNSALHYLVEPLHIGPVILLVIAGVATAFWLKRRRIPQRQHAASDVPRQVMGGRRQAAGAGRVSSASDHRIRDVSS